MYLKYIKNIVNTKDLSGYILIEILLPNQKFQNLNLTKLAILCHNLIIYSIPQLTPFKKIICMEAMPIHTII